MLLLGLVQCCWYGNEFRTELLILNGNYCAANTQLKEWTRRSWRLKSSLSDFTGFYAKNPLPFASGENWRGQQVNSKIDHEHSWQTFSNNHWSGNWKLKPNTDLLCCFSSATALQSHDKYMMGFASGCNSKGSHVLHKQILNQWELGQSHFNKPEIT